MLKLLDDYYQHLRVRNYSEETIYAHRIQLKCYCVFLLAESISSPIHATKQTISRFQTHLYERENKHGRRNSPQSQNNTLKVVRVFYKWLHAEGLIKADPTKDLLYAKEPRALPRLAPTTTETRRLLHGPGADTLLGFRDSCILEVFYGSGIRSGELRRLRVDEIDLQAHTIRVNRGKGNKDRVVPMTTICGTMLARYLKEVRPQLIEGKKDLGFLFVSLKQAKIGRSLPGLVVKHAAREAGLTRRVFPHALRAACMTHMLRNSKNTKQNILRPLMEMAGHSDLTTLHLYTAVDISELKEIHAKTHPRELEQG